jgi:hypothetical protein
MSSAENTQLGFLESDVFLDELLLAVAGEGPQTVNGEQ